MEHRTAARSLLIAAALLVAGWDVPTVFAQDAAAPDSVLPGRPDAPASAELDPAFISLNAGIAVRPPTGGKMIQRTGGDEVVRFTSEAGQWTLAVSRILLADPVPIAARENNNPNNRPAKVSGFAETMASQMPSDTPGKLIRTDLQPINGYDGALLASRYTDKNAKKLMQQAIVRRTDKLYYVVTYTTPLTQDELETDPAAQKAMETFAKVVDTIELLDQQKIADDQTDRLVRSRAIMVNWTPDKLRAALVPEQWLRLLKDGKDIGYTYIVEEPAADLPRRGERATEGTKTNGVRVGVRSRTVPQSGTSVDAESWMWVQDDRRRETFNNVLVSTERGKEKDFIYAMDAGMSVRQDRIVPVKGLEEPGALGNGGEVRSGINDRYTLKVVSNSKNQSMPPVDRDLPPYYLPQALVHLMPRLLPLKEPRTYLFASYVPETRQVMLRYVDVMPLNADVQLGGKTYTAVPIKERAGLEGSTTTHYLTPEGKYLGSVNEDNQITILSTDEKTLREIWKDAKFERPGDVDDSKKPTPQ